MFFGSMITKTGVLPQRKERKKKQTQNVCLTFESNAWDLNLWSYAYHSEISEIPHSVLANWSCAHQYWFTPMTSNCVIQEPVRDNCRPENPTSILQSISQITMPPFLNSKLAGMGMILQRAWFENIVRHYPLWTIVTRSILSKIIP